MQLQTNATSNAEQLQTIAVVVVVVELHICLLQKLHG